MNGFTLREFCAQHPGAPIYAVRYALERARISEAYRVGNVKVFSHDQLPLILSAIKRYTRLPEAALLADLPTPVAM